MAKRGTTDELARKICRDLYEFTDGWPMEWRKAAGGDSMHRALEHLPSEGGFCSMLAIAASA
jgi:hypothetical protein